MLFLQLVFCSLRLSASSFPRYSITADGTWLSLQNHRITEFCDSVILQWEPQRTHTPGSSNAASAARSLHGAPPAALLQLVNASTGKTMPYHKVAIKTGLSSDSPSENPVPLRAWPAAAFRGVWERCAGTQPGDRGEFGARLQQRQAGREPAMLEICCRASEPWRLLVLKSRRMKAAAGTSASAASPPPMRRRRARRLQSSERAARSWAPLKNWLRSWVPSAFAKTLAQRIWLSSYFFSSPYCPNNLITRAPWEVAGGKQWRHSKHKRLGPRCFIIF